PTLIEVKTIIGYGSPNKSDSSASHGAPLGTDEVTLTKEYYQWTYEEFAVPDEVYADFNEKIVQKGERLEKEWNRSEEHTSELQSRFDLVCRLLLEKKNNIILLYRRQYDT